ncbi:phage minor capsid protein [Nonomuraea dietziae]|uniref:phage minor capsid protein n=1 Tax=Nonomuraea dietziae TaxID=65515 RepID=UPI00340A33E2
MAVDQDLLDQIAGTIADLYRDVETALVKTIAQRLRAELPLPSPFQEEKLDAVRKLQAAAQAIVLRLQKARVQAIRQAVADAYRTGQQAALVGVPKAIADQARAAETVIPNARLIENIAQALHRDVGRVDANILRAPVDAYRAVQAATAARIATGSYTRREASQAAWSRLIDKGIVDFIDRANRRWKLSSYVEMMARTNIQRAAVQGQTDRLAEIGIDLVYISDNVQECRVCRPFESRVLRRDAGPIGDIKVEHATRDDELVTVHVLDTLAGAMAKGLWHPNCRHSASAYLPGVTKLRKGTADPEGDVARQRQRYLERKIRAAKEQEAGALDEAAKKAARVKVRAAQAELRAHLAAHPDLKRLPYREQIGAGNIPKGEAPGGPVTDLQPSPPSTPDPEVAKQAAAQAEAERKAAELAAGKAAEEKAKQEAERAAAEEKARKEAEEAAKARGVEGGDFSNLRQVGPQGGSNPGGLFEDEAGVRWYVKTQQSELHAANEIAAARLYTEAGILAPDIHAGRGAPGLPDGPQTASRIVDAVPASAEQLRGPARAGFGVDAWLASWDVAGLTFDNMLLTPDGRVARIDTGGSLLYRAQGDPKGSKWGDKVPEWLSLRDPQQAPQAARLFGGLTPAEQEHALQQVEKVTPDAIRRIVADSGLPPHVADTLIARRADLLRRIPAVRDAARRHRAYEQARANAATGQAALDAASRRLGIDPPTLEPRPPWADDQVEESELALFWYRENGYEDINRWLRAGDPDHAQIRAIDRVMDASPLTRPVVAHRGIQKPRLVFGDAWSDVDITGLEWEDAAYVSVSVDERVASEFAVGGHPPLMMRILTPAGAPVVRLSDLASPDKDMWGISEEAELLNKHGIRYRVVADHGYDADGVRHIDVEVTNR